MQKRTNLDKLLLFKDLELVKLITGVRRSGKSFLLKLLKEHLLTSGVQLENIVYLNFEDLDNAHLLTALDLHQYIKENGQNKTGKVYYLFDEIQFVEDWQKLVNSLRLQEDADIYLTGSNAKMLSGELATLLTGRYIRLEMTPLSYTEYLDFKGVTKQDTMYLSTHFDQYMKYGGFPLVALQNNEDVKKSILSGIYGDIVLRDIAVRGEITDVNMLERVVRFLLDNIGQSISATNIANTFKSSGIAVSPNTISRIIQLLKDAYLFYECSRYDLRGKNRLKNTPKYYVVDTGLRNNELGKLGGNYGGQLENIVFLQLFREEYEVYTGRLDTKEIDFVAMKDGKVVYIQVALKIPENTHETDNLLLIKDNYKKLVVTYDLGSVGMIDGIPVVHIEDFLLKGVEGVLAD